MERGPTNKQQQSREAVPKRHLVRRLDQMLVRIENELRLHGAFNRAIARLEGKTPAFIFEHPEYVREHLRSITDPDQYDFQKIYQEPMAYTKKNLSLMENIHEAERRRMFFRESFFRAMPMLLAHWVTSSRRVYHADADLELTLLATKFGKLRWSDVKFPFESFGVSLDIPLKSEDGKYEYDFILVSAGHREEAREGEAPAVSMLLVPTGFEQIQPVSELTVKDIERDVRRGRFDRAQKKCVRAARRMPEGELDMGTRVLGDERIDVSNEVDDITGNQNSLPVQQAMQLVMGFLLYLENIATPSQIIERRYTAPKPRRTGNLSAAKPLVESADIFLVTSTVKLAPHHRELYRRKFIERERGVEMSAHFRSGFWHRPRGKGHDPDYPKTEQTRPTIVRRDKLAPGELPVGREVTIKKKKPSS